MEKTLFIKDKKVSIYCSDDYTNDTHIFYTISLGTEDDSNIYKLVQNENIILVSIEVSDWNSELSPWFSKKVFAKADDFSGMAYNLLKTIENDIVTEVEKTLNITANHRTLIGYSLAGLFALWAGYQTNIFQSFGSISGSLWFEGFVDFVKSNNLGRHVNKIYISLGDKESNTKNPVTSKVKDCTIEIENHLKKLGIQTLFEMNPSNHFHDVPLRMCKAIRYLNN